MGLGLQKCFRFSVLKDKNKIFATSKKVHSSDNKTIV